jgi:ubiquilin
MLANMIRNPEMRRMLFNPEIMRMQLQMQRAMGGGGGQRMAAPGVTDTTPQPNASADGTTTTPNQSNTTGSTQQQDPFAALLGANVNPFAPNGSRTAQWQQSQNNNTNSEQPASGTTSPSAANPFGNLFSGSGADGQPNPIAEMTRQMMQNPEAMQAAMNMFGQMQGGSGFPPFGAPPSMPDTGAANSGTTSPPAMNPFAALFGPGGGFGAGGFGSPPPPPQDNRPPEEVYEVQLRQLNEMGFFEFDRNVSALRRSGGNVQGAIDYLLGGGS